MANKPKEKPPLAGRLTETAHAAGLTAEGLAEQLGVTSGAVYAWWSGRNEPSVETLLAYARLVGRSFGYVAIGEEEAVAAPVTFGDWVMAFTDRVMAGADPAAAYDQVTGRPDALSDRERRSLSRRAARIRRYVEGIAGAPWGELTPERRREVLEQLAAEEMRRGEE